MVPIADIKPDMSFVTQVLSAERALGLIRAVMVMAVGAVLASGARRGLGRVLGARLAGEQKKLVCSIVGYLVIGLSLTWALREMGFEISVLLGAAGAVTVGLSIASQTSASNLISGLFLVVEQPFFVGDVIEVAGLTGTVSSIDILSTKLKTPDNLFVRVPNETVLKAAVTNVTRFDTRRQTIDIAVDIHADPQVARELLMALATAEPLIHRAPEPLVFLAGYDARALHYSMLVWSDRTQLLSARSALLSAVPAALARVDIKLPQPWPLPPAPGA